MINGNTSRISQFMNQITEDLPEPDVMI